MEFNKTSFYGNGSRQEIYDNNSISEDVQGIFKIEEIGLNIFSFLSVKDLGCVAQVSKDIKRISEDDKLWKKFWLEEFNINILLKDATPNEKLFEGSFKSKIQKTQQSAMSIFLQSVEGKYGIELNEIQVATWWRADKEAIIAKDYMNPASERVNLGDDAPIQFTYAEGFEYIIRKINYRIFKQKDTDLPTADKKLCFCSQDDLVAALTNLEHKKKELSTASSKFRRLYKLVYCHWPSIKGR